MHAALGVLNILIGEPFLEIDSVHRINRPHEVAFVTERDRGIDAHAALEISIRCGPLSLAGGHALSGHERLAPAAWKRIDDISFWIDASGEIPNDVVHVIRIRVFADRDHQARTLRCCEDGGHEVTLPAFFNAVAFLDLNDGAAPIGHTVRNIDVHDQAGLHSFAELEHGGFAHRRVDIVIVESMNAEREDDRLAFAPARGHRGNDRYT